MYIALRKKKEIDRVFKAGRGKKGRFFLLKYVMSSDQTAKIIIIVTKKIDKKAVVRNRNKRKIREALRKVKIRTGFHYALIALSDISKIKQTEIEEEMQRIF
jgi:ribonuclease P protein component